MLNNTELILVASRGTRSVLGSSVTGVQGELALATDSQQPAICPANEQPFLFMLTLVAVPASSTAPGYPGQVAMDATYFYYCYAANAWARIAKDAW